MRAIRRILTVTALAPWLAVSAAVPPEHVHESDAADHHSVVHRHLAPHEHAGADVSDPDHDGADVSDADGHIVWLDQIAITETPHSFPEFLAVASTHLALTARPVRRAVVAADTATLPHGPPRVSLSLRAPPSIVL